MKQTTEQTNPIILLLAATIVAFGIYFGLVHKAELKPDLDTHYVTDSQSTEPATNKNADNGTEPETSTVIYDEPAESEVNTVSKIWQQDLPVQNSALAIERCRIKSTNLEGVSMEEVLAKANQATSDYQETNGPVSQEFAMEVFDFVIKMYEDEIYQECIDAL